MNDSPGLDKSGNRRLEIVLGSLLRIGVIVSASVVLLGGVIYLIRHGGEASEYGAFRGEPSDLRSVAGILRDVLQLESRAILQFGFLLLIATPVVRVALSLVGFARQRDWLYVAATAIVLALLLYSLFGT
jgi:uncharacterized membrane protein